MGSSGTIKLNISQSLGSEPTIHFLARHHVYAMQKKRGGVLIQKKKHVQDDTNVIEIKKAWPLRSQTENIQSHHPIQLKHGYRFHHVRAEGGGVRRQRAVKASRRTSGKVVSRKVMFCLEVS